MRPSVTPRLTLVGAGPGDPDLISVKGIKALADADVVLYDALVNKELLTYASSRAKLIYVGKRAGKHSHKQDEINQLIVNLALNQGHVVRLKGGDPFIFGRGFEEIEFAERFGIITSIVPGISSAHAVPALQKIPLTSRGTNQSYWVVTGTTSSGQLSHDLKLASRSSATIVILMGMKKLEEITRLFCRQKKEDIPAAVIQNGSLPNEKKIFGQVSNIHQKAQEAGLSAPAIIIIGETVALGKERMLRHIPFNQNLIYHGQ